MNRRANESETPKVRFAFPASLRLKRGAEFDAVYAVRTFRRSGPLTVHALPNERGMTRLGLSVSRTAGSAVVRNRIKRLLREAFRLTQHDLPQSYDLVVSVRRHEPLTLQEYQSLLHEAVLELDQIWRKRQRRRDEEQHEPQGSSDAAGASSDETTRWRAFVASVSLSSRAVVAQSLIWLVRLYQVTLGPFMGGHCRFQPTCSVYAIEALRTHGAMRGTWLTTRRIVRCHPLGGFGYDPVPQGDQAVDRKFEMRNPKFETNSHEGNHND